MGDSSVISRFAGIVVFIPLRDHNPPHVHAKHGNHSIAINIQTGETLKGTLPPAQYRKVLGWMIANQNKLMDDWELASKGQYPNPIEGW